MKNEVVAAGIAKLRHNGMLLWSERIALVEYIEAMERRQSQSEPTPEHICGAYDSAAKLELTSEHCPACKAQAPEVLLRDSAKHCLLCGQGQHRFTCGEAAKIRAAQFSHEPQAPHQYGEAEIPLDGRVRSILHDWEGTVVAIDTRYEVQLDDGRHQHNIGHSELEIVRAQERGAQPVRRRYEFNRYRNGKLMAEGVIVHAANIDEAVEKANALRPSNADTLELRPPEDCIYEPEGNALLAQVKPGK